HLRAVGFDHDPVQHVNRGAAGTRADKRFAEVFHRLVHAGFQLQVGIFQSGDSSHRRLGHMSSSENSVETQNYKPKEIAAGKSRLGTKPGRDSALARMQLRLRRILAIAPARDWVDLPGAFAP